MTVFPFLSFRHICGWGRSTTLSRCTNPFIEVPVAILPEPATGDTLVLVFVRWYTEPIWTWHFHQDAINIIIESLPTSKHCHAAQFIFWCIFTLARMSIIHVSVTGPLATIISTVNFFLTWAAENLNFIKIVGVTIVFRLILREFLTKIYS